LILSLLMIKPASFRHAAQAWVHPNRVVCVGVALLLAGLQPAQADPRPLESSRANSQRSQAPVKSPAGQNSTLVEQAPSTAAPAAGPTPEDDPLAALLRQLPTGAGLPPLRADVNLPNGLGNTPAAARPELLGSVRDKASTLVTSAMTFLGVPYKRGGKTAESGFDCSGFTRHIFESTLGLLLPHRAEEQARLSSLIPVKREELRPGDLVFFNTMRRTFSHVGIYVGEGRFIHAPRAGGEVRVEELRVAYWKNRFTGARRVEALGQTPTVTQGALPSGAATLDNAGQRLR
jgi:cell wall-associated NlpC family hydrolase